MRNILFSTLILLKSILVLSSNTYTIHTTLRGKKYTLNNVSTVKEVQQSLLEQSGEPSTSNIILLFGGQKLKSNDVLEDIGVEDGSVMNAIPASSTKKKKKHKAATEEKPIDSSASSSSMPDMEELMKKSGLDPSIMNNLFPQGEGAPNLEQSMKMMQDMIQTPYFQEFLNDPDKMEESRQLLLQNPMMKGMLDSIPFMKDIIGNKDAFRQTMLSAAQMYKDMGDGDGMAEAMQKMNGMFGGMPGLDMNGMFDKKDSLLDELSEGEDED